MRSSLSWALVVVLGLGTGLAVIATAAALGWAVGLSWVFILAAVGVVFLAFDVGRWIRRGARWIRWKVS